MPEISPVPEMLGGSTAYAPTSGFLHGLWGRRGTKHFVVRHADYTE